MPPHSGPAWKRFVDKDLWWISIQIMKKTYIFQALKGKTQMQKKRKAHIQLLSPKVGLNLFPMGPKSSSSNPKLSPSLFSLARSLSHSHFQGLLQNHVFVSLSQNLKVHSRMYCTWLFAFNFRSVWRRGWRGKFGSTAIRRSTSPKTRSTFREGNWLIA